MNGLSEPSVQATGIDFGTSNTSVGLGQDDQVTLVDFHDGNQSIPSAIFYAQETDDVVFGKQAVAEYTSGVEGRLLRALKTILGSSLIQEKTLIRNQRIAFADIICDFFHYLHRTVTHRGRHLADQIVIGRPVHFVDDDPEKDRLAEQQLKEIALNAGFVHVEFQFEPIAAALDYESQINREQLALIVDIGGGTADFSIIRLSPQRHHEADRNSDILAAMGVHIGGTDLDQLLSLHSVMPHLGLGSLVRNTQREQPRSVFFDLATWHRIPLLYNRDYEHRIRQMQVDADEPQCLAALASIVKEREGHLLASKVEQLKIELSEKDQAELTLPISKADPLSVSTSRNEFELAIDNAIDSLVHCAEQGLRDAQVSNASIGSVYFTGGCSFVPRIRKAMEQAFPAAVHISGDNFSSVARGLTLDAVRRFA